MARPLNSGKITFVVFCLLPLIYFLLLGWWGFSDTDQGFIPSLSYRITQGEVIGEDFIYVRPPLSPYFHTLEIALLPDHLEMIGSRLWFYVCMWLTVYWGVASLKRFLNFEEMGFSPWMLGILAFVYSVHNFPAMPWHTVDGIFFAMAGFYVLTRGEHWANIVCGLGLMGISALSKQPFAVAPLVGIVLLFFLYPRKSVLKGLGATAIAGLVLAAPLLLIESTRSIISTNLMYIRAASGSNDFLESALLNYKPAVIFGTPALLLWFGLKYVLRTKHTGWIMAAVVLTVLAAWIPHHAYAVWKGGHFRPPRFAFYHLLLLGGCFAAALHFFKPERRKAMMLILSMGAISWASGISWGYSFPVLLALPGLAGILYFLSTINEYKIPRWATLAVAVVAFGSYIACYRYPYTDRDILELDYHLGDVFPRLSYIYTNEVMYDKHVHLKTLHGKYGDNFAVLPSMPMAHYLTNTPPTIQVDWAHDGEIGFELGRKVIVDRLERQRTTVFVERERYEEAYDEGNYKCSVLLHVLNHWEKVEEGPHFFVYQMPGTRPDSASISTP